MSSASNRRWRGRFFRRVFTRVGLLLASGILVVSFLTWEIMHASLIEYIDQQLRNNVRLADLGIAGGWPYASPGSLVMACRAIRDSTGLRTTVIDPAGHVLADSDADAASMENHADRPEVAAALAGRIEAHRRSSATVRQPYIYVAAPMLRDGRIAAVVRVATPLADLQKREAALLRSMAWALGISLPLALIIAGLLARRIAGPVQQVSAWAHRLASGDLDAKLSVGTGDEIGRVADSLERMRVNLAARVREVQQRRQDLEVTLTHLEEGVIAVGEQGTVLMANEAAHRLLGMDAPLTHQPLADRLPNEALRSLWARARAGARHELRQEIALGAPSPRTLGVTVTRVDASQSPIAWLMCLRDITVLARSAEMKSDFVANASHELRTPVSAIRAAVETLRSDGLDVDQRGRFVSVIERNVSRLQDLTEDLMQLNRVEAANPELHIAAVELDEVFSSLRAAFNEQLHRKEAHLSFVSGVSDAVTDAKWLELILKNLIDNAVKFIGERGCVAVRVVRKDERIAFEVEDDGCGIPAKDLERVFERFYQVDTSRALNVGGTGLGLAIVKHAVHGLGGDVTIRSEVGRGTTVSFWIPASG